VKRIRVCVLALLAFGPTAAAAADFDLIDVGGCSIPVPEGWTPSTEVASADTLAHRLTFDGEQGSLHVSWSPAAPTVDSSTVAQFADGLIASGVHVFVEETRQLPSELPIWQLSTRVTQGDIELHGVAIVWFRADAQRLHQWALLTGGSKLDLSSRERRTSLSELIASGVRCEAAKGSSQPDWIEAAGVPASWSVSTKPAARQVTYLHPSKLTGITVRPLPSSELDPCASANASGDAFAARNSLSVLSSRDLKTDDPAVRCAVEATFGTGDAVQAELMIEVRTCEDRAAVVQRRRRDRRWPWPTMDGVRCLGASEEVQTRAAAADALPPPLATLTLLQPTFETPVGPLTHGAATVVLHADRTWLLTAHHHFSEHGPLGRNYLADELPSLVQGVKAATVLPPRVLMEIGPPTVLEHARALTLDAAQFDLAAFPMKGRRRGALELAEELPPPNSPIWVVADPDLGAPRPHLAWLSSAPDTGLIYYFDDENLVLSAVGGSPVLNADGNLIGLHLSQGISEGRAYGVANPVGSIRRMLGGAKP
jgi:hypothetical protein